LVVAALLLVPIAVTAQPTPAPTPSYRHLRPLQNMFEPLGRPAEEISTVAWWVLATCGGIFVVVTGLATYALIKYRRRGPEDDLREPPQVYGSASIEMAWTIPPIMIAVVLMLITSRTIGEIQDAKMPDNAIQIRVVGHQWWWEVHYPGYGIVTANEIHVPVSSRDEPRPIRLNLESADVIHSFWVPQLNGKTDLIPNKENQMWIEPFQTGTYLGNCAEYCGTQHARMLLRVVVQEPHEFLDWVYKQKSVPVDEPAAQAGKQAFARNTCVSCHQIGTDTGAPSKFGPDLTHLMSRQTFAAGAAPLNAETLRSWVRDPQVLKPGCLMPNMGMSDQEVDQIVAYLLTLK
jgi:cytochrome c oxidase subunit II